MFLIHFKERFTWYPVGPNNCFSGYAIRHSHMLRAGQYFSGFIFLISNQSRDLYLADMEGEKTITDNGLRIQGKGSYSFTIEDNKPYLTLIYATDDKGAVTNNPAYSPEAHKFQITQGSEFMLHDLDENLNLGRGIVAKNFSED